MTLKLWEEWHRIIDEVTNNPDAEGIELDDYTVLVEIDKHIKTLHNIVNGEYS